MSTIPLPPFRHQHQVMTYETGQTGAMTPSALIHLLQHTAGKHANELGWSVRGLHEAGLTWVLQRFYLEINRLPEDDTRFTIETRPSGADRILAYRDYRVMDEDGECLALATSSWVVMDLESRRPVAITDEIRELGSQFGPRYIEAPKTRQQAFEPAPDTPIFRVRKHDLDLNGHVNNVRYIEWALESVPNELFLSGNLRTLDITFKAECFFGDEIISAQRQADPETYEHTLLKASDQKVVSLLRTTWDK